MQFYKWMVALAILPAATAATVTLTPTSFGFYLDNGGASANNHAIGWYGGGNEEIRNYLVFDRSAVNGTITGATLRLQDPSSGYSSPDPQETWAIFDVSVSLASLSAGTGGLTAYQDLASGTMLGSLVVNNANTGTIISMALNGNGITYLNAQSGAFALGGALTTLAKTNGVSERLFNNGFGALVRELELTYTPSAPGGVPEPATYLLLGAGLLSIGLFRRKS